MSRKGIILAGGSGTRILWRSSPRSSCCRSTTSRWFIIHCRPDRI